MSQIASVYPDNPAERDLWILAQRGTRETLDPAKPYAFLVEEERFASGEIGSVATIFLTNKECPWRCVMCDLWRNTLPTTAPRGSITTQIQSALDLLPPARQIKLYNSGSFFDSQAIPLDEYQAVANCVSAFERVIVESHPALVGERSSHFAAMLSGKLEVAMGLETVHPEVLQRLNKKMTLDQYRAAADRLQADDIDLRSFVLIQPPFMRVNEALEWACRSIDFAFSCGATAVSLLPTRAGNGAMDALQVVGDFVPPTLAVVEEAFHYGLLLRKGRVFIDLWEIDRVQSCSHCKNARIARLARMNGSQQIEDAIHCVACGAVA